ncbi:MAG TPA: hypothetical protein VMG99_08790 [Thermoplasmata archaeon]|nr:hypothetical protein [Thermoplasmata archaeon]
MPWTTGQKVEAALLVGAGAFGVGLTIFGIVKGLQSIDQRTPPPPPYPPPR